MLNSKGYTVNLYWSSIRQVFAVKQMPLTNGIGNVYDPKRMMEGQENKNANTKPTPMTILVTLLL